MTGFRHPATAALDSTGPGEPIDADRLIFSLAARQHGAVSRAQLLRAGVSPDLLDHRLRAGRLQRLHRGVYLAGSVMAPCTREMAAALACGDASAVSHCCAAALRRMLPPREKDAPVEIAVIRGRAGPRPGIRVRRLRSITPDEITLWDGIPITTPARTLFDLSATVGDRELERALAEALSLRLVEESDLRDLLERRANRPGARRLRRLLEDGEGPALVRSEAESRFLQLVRRARLEPPAVNVRVAGFEVDFLWRAERFVVEVDGRAFHSSERRFQEDRRRDATLLAAGVRVMRVTWQQIADEPEALLVRLGAALALPAQV